MAQARGSIALAGDDAARTVFGSGVEATILSWFSMWEAARLRLVSKQLKAATAACCTFAEQAEHILEGSPVDGRRLSSFRSCFPRAEVASVNARHMSDPEAVHLRGIRILMLSCQCGAQLTDAGIRALANPDLRHLDIVSAPGIRGAGFSSLQSLERLKLLNLRGLDSSVCRFPPNLRTLDMELCRDQAVGGQLSLSIFTGLEEHLRELRLLDAELLDEEGSPLLHLPRLQSLELIHDDRVPVETEKDLANRPARRFCPFHWSRFPALGTFTLTLGEDDPPPACSLTHLAAGVRELSLEHVPVADAALSHLEALEELTLASTGPDFTGACLARFPRLRQLNCSDCSGLRQLRFAAAAPLVALIVGPANPLLKDGSFANTNRVQELFVDESESLTEGVLRHFPSLRTLGVNSGKYWQGPGVSLFARQCPTLRRVWLCWHTDSLTDSPPLACAEACVNGLKAAGFVEKNVRLSADQKVYVIDMVRKKKKEEEKAGGAGAGAV